MRTRKERIHLGVGTLIWVTALLVVTLATGHATPESVIEHHDRELSAVAGEQVANACVSCHDLQHRTHRIGPHLMGVLGRHAGRTSGYDYSDAMRSSGIVWNEKTLSEFLKEPSKMVPGTKMGLSGMAESDIKTLVEYIKEQQ